MENKNIDYNKYEVRVPLITIAKEIELNKIVEEVGFEKIPSPTIAGDFDESTSKCVYMPLTAEKDANAKWITFCAILRVLLGSLVLLAILGIAAFCVEYILHTKTATSSNAFTFVNVTTTITPATVTTTNSTVSAIQFKMYDLDDIIGDTYT